MTIRYTLANFDNLRAYEFFYDSRATADEVCGLLLSRMHYGRTIIFGS